MTETNGKSIVFNGGSLYKLMPHCLSNELKGLKEKYTLLSSTWRLKYGLLGDVYFYVKILFVENTA